MNRGEKLVKQLRYPFLGCLRIIGDAMETADPSKFLIDEEQTDKEPKSGQIFLSYCSSIKSFVRRLNQQLENEGFETSMYDDTLEFDDFLDTLQAAIVNCATMIICISSGYKGSAICRMEAQYALKKKKPILFVMADKAYEPDGWMENIVGQATYFNLADQDKYIINYTKLVAQLRKIYEESWRDALAGISISAGKGPSEEAASEGEKAGPQATKIEPVSVIWTVQDVQNWLKQSNLDFLLEGYHSYL